MKALIDSDSKADDSERYEAMRRKMVEDQIIRRGIRNNRVIQAMLQVPRHAFAPLELKESSYNDNPIPIDSGQTISQPYIVALMTELLNPEPRAKILEIGTGSGYQTAVLRETGCELWTIEILKELALKAQSLLQKLGCDHIEYKIGDGYMGWGEYAPYDGIIVTAAPKRIPHKLVEQLKEGCKMVIPVGYVNQELVLLEKLRDEVITKRVTSVKFVPMTSDRA